MRGGLLRGSPPYAKKRKLVRTQATFRAAFPSNQQVWIEVAILKFSLRKTKDQTFFERHGLTIVTSCILLAWIVLYSVSDEKRHIGSFFGNAIADWTGVVVMILATKHLYERGSSESKEPKKKLPIRFLETLREHSLTVFLLVTGIGWVLLYAHSDSESKWGQVVGNIVSEWTQILGLVLLTKKLIEAGSKESDRHK